MNTPKIFCIGIALAWAAIASIYGGPIDPYIPFTIREFVTYGDSCVIARPTGTSKNHKVQCFVKSVLKTSSGKPVSPGNEIWVKDIGLGPLFLVSGSRDKNGLLEWKHVREITDECNDYLLSVARTKTRTELLSQCLRYIENKDPTIHDDVFDELNRAHISELVAVANQVPCNQIAALIRDSRLSHRRIATYSLLLGIAGDTSSLAMVKQLMLEAADRNKRGDGLDKIICAFVLLSGDEGVSFVKSRWLVNSKDPFGLTYNTLLAIKFAADVPNRVSRDSICGAIHPLLDCEDLVDVAINDLARFQDWSVQDQVATVYYKARILDSTSLVRHAIQNAVINYMKAAEKDVPKDGKEVPLHAAKASNFLNNISK